MQLIPDDGIKIFPGKSWAEQYFQLVFTSQNNSELYFHMSSHMIPTHSHRCHIWALYLQCLVVLGQNKAGNRPIACRPSAHTDRWSQWSQCCVQEYIATLKPLWAALLYITGWVFSGFFQRLLCLRMTEASEFFISYSEWPTLILVLLFAYCDWSRSVPFLVLMVFTFLVPVLHVFWGALSGFLVEFPDFWLLSDL